MPLANTNAIQTYPTLNQSSKFHQLFVHSLVKLFNLDVIGIYIICTYIYMYIYYIYIIYIYHKYIPYI